MSKLERKKIQDMIESTTTLDIGSKWHRASICQIPLVPRMPPPNELAAWKFDHFVEEAP